MCINKKLFSVATLAVVVIVLSSNISPKKGNFTNLKVLPHNISEQQLDSLMDVYCKALKVSCDFCHSPAKDITGVAPAKDGSLDFAVDNSMKEEARRMMKMTIDINKTYFKTDSAAIGKQDYQLNMISCNSCHRGNPYPAHE